MQIIYRDVVIALYAWIEARKRKSFKFTQVKKIVKHPGLLRRMVLSNYIQRAKNAQTGRYIKVKSIPKKGTMSGGTTPVNLYEPTSTGWCLYRSAQQKAQAATA